MALMLESIIFFVNFLQTSFFVCILNCLFNYVSYQDENRFSAVRGAHKNLKRAEKARSLISKIPGESLVALLG